MKNTTLATFIVIAAACVGCEDKTRPSGSSSAPTPPTQTSTAPAGGSHEQHGHIPLGTQMVQGMTLVATQDAPLAPGGEGAFDVVIKPTKPKAVRFWVGTESGEGSAKAKAEEETPDNWHTHAEVPSPLPPGSKFWVEVEPQTGEKFTVSFEPRLK